MPVQLVNYTLRTMGLAGQRPAMTPSQIYQLALELGVSYTAVVTQLVCQHKLSIDAGRRLRKLSPLDIKTGLAGVKPASSRADVWLLDEAQEGRQIISRLRDEIHVRLPETPSTGYVWDLVDPAAGVVEVVADRFETGDDAEERIGADGVRHLWLRVLRRDRAGSGWSCDVPGSPTRSLHAPFRRHSTRWRRLREMSPKASRPTRRRA
jgi:predicted secreted protein